MKSKFLLGAVLGLFIVAVIFISPLIFAFGKTGRDIQVLGRDYSMLGKQQIINRLDRDFPLPVILTLQGSGRNFTLDTASISARVNSSRLVSDLLFRRLNQGLGNYLKAFMSPRSFVLEVNYDDNALDQYLNSLGSQINQPFVPYELQVSGASGSANALVVKKGELGVELDTPVLKQQLVDALINYQVAAPIVIPVKNTGHLPSSSEITQTQDRALALLGKSLILTGVGNDITLDDKTLISWLSFDGGYDRSKISDYINSVSLSLKKDPVNAVFRVENNKVLEFQPAQNGLIVETSALLNQLPSSLDNLSRSGQKTLTLTVPTQTLGPLVKTEDVNNLGIKELLGSGTSTFKHSDQTRNFNIQKGASLVNSILVAPGDTFSFVKNLGDVTLDTGFKKAYIIRAGHTELDVGGGICQVSTTLFRAMLNSGMDIIERQPHAYRVSYYEEDSPPGFDATVFVPSPDLKFINDTGHYVLIQNTLNLKEKRLTYEIYGTSDGRHVDISNYRKWDAAPPPPDINIDDPTLPPGKTVQDEHAIPGLKTAFDWKVIRDGQIIHQKTFQSYYTPWAAVYRHGPGI